MVDVSDGMLYRVKCECDEISVFVEPSNEIFVFSGGALIQLRVKISA